MRTMKLTIAVAALVAAGSLALGSTPASGAAEIYTARCAGCHAPDGSGNISGTPDFRDAAWQASRTDAQLTAVIANGKGMMPAWKSKFSAEQIAGLVAHVRSLKQ